jgi:hypothetical protein
MVPDPLSDWLRKFLALAADHIGEILLRQSSSFSTSERARIAHPSLDIGARSAMGIERNVDQILTGEFVA